jgi:hypothetical protein
MGMPSCLWWKGYFPVLLSPLKVHSTPIGGRGHLQGTVAKIAKFNLLFTKHGCCTDYEY